MNSDISRFTKPNIIVLAYMISPIRGSEYSVAWNHVTHMAKYFNIFVVYGCAGSHMGDFDDMSNDILKLNPSINFIPVMPDNITRVLNAPNVAGYLPQSFYLAYKRWHKQASLTVRQICRNEEISLIHYLGPIGYREPGYVNDCGVPYIWGPIGGLPNFPIHLLAPGISNFKFKMVLKNLINTFQKRFSKRVKVAMNNADTVIAATSENQIEIFQNFGVCCEYLPENGLLAKNILDRMPRANSKFTILWVGDQSSRKGLDLFLESLHPRLKNYNVDVKIIGVEASPKILSINTAIVGFVHFLGRLSRDEVLALYQEADLLVITSLMEGNPTVVWEALEKTLPMVYLSHCGMKDVLSENISIPIEPISRTQIITELSNVLLELSMNPDQLTALRSNIVNKRNDFGWVKRAEYWRNKYHEVINNNLRQRK